MQRRRLLLAVAAIRAAALEVHVVSLTPPTASEHYGAAGRAWRWKVAVMGEDMALPRPKTALALAESIVERSGGAVQEAATLSTCARLLLIVAGNEDAVAATREACAAQIASYTTRPFDDWRRAFDAAGDDIVETSRAAPVVDDDDELGVFEAATGADAGAWLARVVAGAADGPSAFDPFSSRKAHVLKQAKQCLEKCRAGLCGNQPVRYVMRILRDLREPPRHRADPELRGQRHAMARNLRAIEQGQLWRQHRVDGRGVPEI